MPTLPVIWIAKLASWLSRLSGRGEGTALPGLVAERLQPKILVRLGKGLERVILITGTNGKTTTTRMVVAALGEEEVITNRGGSNLTRGLVSALLAASNWRGRLSSKTAIFEVDEATFPAAFQTLKPQAVLVLNLFRDQLDRYGELNTLAAKLKDSLKGTQARVILNADDPLVAWLGEGLSNVQYFGLKAAKVTKLTHDFAADSLACPVCAAPLEYLTIFYAHIGDYHCPRQNFARPKLDVVATTTKTDLQGSNSNIEVGPRTATLNLELPGLYNVYNGLGALTLALGFGINLDQAVKSITEMPPAFGRAERLVIAGQPLQLFLVKNPTGFNQVIQAYRMSRMTGPVLILVNDLIADGRDVSWLWDVAFEDFQPQGPMVAGGTRAYDLALRLKYAELATSVKPELAAALSEFMKLIKPGETGIILPTYTAMLELRRELAKRGAGA